MARVTGKTRALVTEFDTYLDSVVKAALQFEAALKDYLREDLATFGTHLQELAATETEADAMRRSIRHRLYTRMLIPEHRGDVLSILENVDTVVDFAKGIAFKFDIERPVVPDFLHQGLVDLADNVVSAVDFTVKAAKAYFREPAVVDDHLNRVHFHEHEADKLEDALKRQVFASDEKRISAKMQLSGLIELISSIADKAEDVSDRISVAAIKREY